MTNPEKIAFKHSLKKLGLDILRQRMATAQKAMDQAQEAANSEEKSSAGDKYETGRAMGQLQKEMHGRQLAEYGKEVKALQSIVVDLLCDKVGPGAFVQAGDIAFFVSAGLGRQEVEGLSILFVSPLAPLARALHDKRAGDTILFNGTGMVIEDIY
jgi:transcription elongation GreA/GreB family factor